MYCVTLTLMSLILLNTLWFWLCPAFRRQHAQSGNIERYKLIIQCSAGYDDMIEQMNSLLSP